MKLSNYDGAKALSLANALSLSDSDLANALNKNEYLYISYLDDNALKSSCHIRCEIGSISYVLALILAFKFKDEPYFSELDLGHLSGESNLGEEEAQQICAWLYDEKNPAKYIIVDESILAHTDKGLIFALLKKSGLDIVLAGSQDAKDEIQNELSKACELSEPKELESFDGLVAYFYKAKTTNLKANQAWLGLAKAKAGDDVELAYEGKSQKLKLELDLNLKGTVALLGTPNIDGYNFKLVKVIK